jgi:hypothetical protein
MKSAILAVVIAMGIGVFNSSSYAQEAKKLQLHPAAAANDSLRKGNAELPKKGAAISPKEGSGAVARSDTGEAVPSGGTTNEASRSD